jgi:hypothetical protein
VAQFKYKISPKLQNILYIFYKGVLTLRNIYLIKFHLRIRICAAKYFLWSTIHLSFPIQSRNSIATAIFQRKILKSLISYNFPHTTYNPILSYVLLLNFVQLYINVRRDLVPTILLHCIAVLHIYSFMFGLIMAIYSRNM